MLYKKSFICWVERWIYWSYNDIICFLLIIFLFGRYTIYILEKLFWFLTLSMVSVSDSKLIKTIELCKNSFWRNRFYFKSINYIQRANIFGEIIKSIILYCSTFLNYKKKTIIKNRFYVNIHDNCLLFVPDYYKKYWVFFTCEPFPTPSINPDQTTVNIFLNLI